VVVVVVVLSADVVAECGRRAEDLGVSVSEYADVLLRSQLLMLEGLGA
jgi:hypothetical protein